MKQFRETRTPECVCPYCGKKLSAATSATPDDPDAVPEPGCVTVCISCASPLVFADDLTVRALAKDELTAIYDSPVGELLRRAQRAVRDLDRREQQP